MGKHMLLGQKYLDLEQLGKPYCQLLRMGRVEDERSPLPTLSFKKICHVRARIKLTCWELKKSQGLEVIWVKSTKEWDSLGGLHFEGTPEVQNQGIGYSKSEQDLKNPNFKPNFSLK